MSILSPYEVYKRNIIDHKSKKPLLTEAISVSMNNRQAKRAIAEKIRTIANCLENTYVTVPQNEDDYPYPDMAQPVGDYEKHQIKVAKAHEAEIKSLMKEVDAFEAKIKKCCESLRKAEQQKTTK